MNLGQYTYVIVNYGEYFSSMGDENIFKINFSGVVWVHSWKEYS
jgi:hypothetical protein